METPRTATLLRLCVGEQERYGHQPLYEAIVIKAREHGLAGATDLATTRRWHARSERSVVCWPVSDLLDSPAEGCRSGRTGLIRNQVTGLSRPWVRIPLPPPRISITI